MMMNYHPGVPIGEQGQQLFARYRDRYVGSISGESLGYFYPKAEEMRQATANARTRRQLVEAFTPLTLRSNAEKYRAVYGKDLDQNPYEDVIACLSVGNIAFTPLSYLWVLGTAGYESSAMTSSLLAMRWAFLRGAARQNEGLTATYRSCNFGDCGHDLLQRRQLSRAAEHHRELLLRVLRRRDDVVQDGHLVPVHGRLVDVLPRAGL